MLRELASWKTKVAYQEEGCMMDVSGTHAIVASSCISFYIGGPVNCQDSNQKSPTFWAPLSLFSAIPSPDSTPTIWYLEEHASHGRNGPFSSYQYFIDLDL